MIKIPGTPEGVPAIEQAIYEGINVNVTLLFARRELRGGRRGLHPRPRAPRRPRGSRSTCTRSRASSSRASTPRSTSASRRSAASDLAGTAALANARAAYARFEQIFVGERFAALRCARRAGAAAAVGLDRHQEPRLPRDDVRRRAGRPRHGQHDADEDAAGGRRARPRSRPGTAQLRPERRTLAALAAAGIDMDDVTATLLRDGIDSVRRRR